MGFRRRNLNKAQLEGAEQDPWAAQPMDVRIPHFTTYPNDKCRRRSVSPLARGRAWLAWAQRTASPVHSLKHKDSCIMHSPHSPPMHTLTLQDPEANTKRKGLPIRPKGFRPESSIMNIVVPVVSLGAFSFVCTGLICKIFNIHFFGF